MEIYYYIMKLIKMYVILILYVFIYKVYIFILLLSKIYYICIYILVLDIRIYIDFDCICVGIYKRFYIYFWG